VQTPKSTTTAAITTTIIIVRGVDPGEGCRGPDPLKIYRRGKNML